MTGPLRYPAGSLFGDYGRGAIGLLVAGTMWLSLPGTGYVDVIFGGLTLLFALFTIRTAWRQLLRFELLPDGLVQVWPRRRVLLWDRLDSLRLRYYSTRRNREGGWMTLTMRAGDVRMALESTLAGFDAVAERAATAAEQRAVPLDGPTRANFGALGIAGFEPAPAPSVPPSRWRFNERWRRDDRNKNS
ncbi:MAG: hypothetical protein WD044_17535 [Dongiaceae bacterium]